MSSVFQGGAGGEPLLPELRRAGWIALADADWHGRVASRAGPGCGRTDDLKLGQPVALKFLPKVLADDPVRRERFYAEVRIARQVSHPNICRVYDIGELDGRHFLTMEYIDGEDLASLLKRIGRLPQDKALDVAKQSCAGLAAAHDKGVLHRDLKPANVMIDGRGRVWIADFGLAVAEEEAVTSSDISGTPAYMAPEQFAGKGSSVRSDIYAIGLVLYEVYTGRKAFSAPTLAELRAMKESATPAAPSEIAREMDPVVERVILRCMEKDPRQRPASVAQVAGALPGGDPLAAAIAAGETPSPEMVAASGGKEGLKPWAAWTCLAFVIVGVCAAAFLCGHVLLYRRVEIENPSEVRSLLGTRSLLDMIFTQPIFSLFWALATLFLLFLLRVLLRREWIAAAVFILLLTAWAGLGSDSPVTRLFYALKYGVVCFLLVCFGLLANTAHYTVYFWLWFFPITPGLSALYSGIGLAGVLLLLAFAACAFRTSLGGRPMLQTKLLED